MRFNLQDKVKKEVSKRRREGEAREKQKERKGNEEERSKTASFSMPAKTEINTAIRAEICGVKRISQGRKYTIK